MQTIPTVSADYISRSQHRQSSAHADLWNLLDQVRDPEIPVLSIWDLGVLQDIRVEEEGIAVVITPTYSGCPAMTEIRQAILDLLEPEYPGKVSVKIQLAPAWTTDWMSPEGKEQLRDYGIAPPNEAAQSPCCPRCGSPDTAMVSEFGSTACKAFYKCRSCSEPFDYFKCI
ncbi:phenylacetate-CoA oxygenase subunit PaaJ [Proteobacteria bacterium 005FR1]|nr:phenylacetate-CoA oxygenase subunit PaaJ [Proteobacteria bacterium 005FR1]